MLRKEPLKIVKSQKLVLIAFDGSFFMEEEGSSYYHLVNAVTLLEDFFYTEEFTDHFKLISIH